MVLVVLPIRYSVKILKNWYAGSIPDNAILSDVYNKYSAGILDQSATLPERYNAGFRPIVASIGRSLQSLTETVAPLQLVKLILHFINKTYCRH